MSRKQLKRTLLMGAGCAVFLLAGIVYSLLYNDGRWGMEMNLEEYVFSAKDIPMLAAGMLVALYAVYIAVVICRKALKGLSTQKGLHQNYTRRVPPFLGIFGIFGLWGFSGFWTYYAHGIVSPFLLFALFGLFGLFFEGKLSHTLEDELFQHNKARADLKAYKTGFLLLVAVILLSRWRVLALHAEWCAILLLISVSLIVAFVLFQKRYPLYCYEKEE